MPQVISTTQQDFNPSGQYRFEDPTDDRAIKPLTIEQQYAKRLADLQNPDSELYRNAEVGLMRLLNQTSPTVATLTSAQRAGGLSVGSASAIANKQRESSELRNREKASMAKGQLFQKNQGLINNIINSSASFELKSRELDLMEKQFDEQMDASFWNNIVNGLIGVGSIALAPATGGGSLVAGGMLNSQQIFRSPNPQWEQQEINDPGYRLGD